MNVTKKKNMRMGWLQRRDTYDEAVMASMVPKLPSPPNREASVIINSPYAELMRMPFYSGYGIAIMNTAKQDDDINKGVRDIGDGLDGYAAMDAARHRARMRTMTAAVQTDAAAGDGLGSGYNKGEEGELTRPQLLGRRGGEDGREHQEGPSLDGSRQSYGPNQGGE